MKVPFCCLALAVLFLAACKSMSAESEASDKVEQSPTSRPMTGTTAPTDLTSTSPTRPTIAATPAVSPAAKDNPRWVIYEKALSKAVINKDDGLCEWEILGISGSEVYVWVLCKARDWPGTPGSVPAVIHLAKDGEIKGVNLPRDGNYFPKDIRTMFPSEVQTKIFHRDFVHCCTSEDHIKTRMITNGPPMSVIMGTPLPSSIAETPTPTTTPSPGEAAMLMKLR
jgi:hypothetical protein